MSSNITYEYVIDCLEQLRARHEDLIEIEDLEYEIWEETGVNFYPPIYEFNRLANEVRVLYDQIPFSILEELRKTRLDLYYFLGEYVRL